MVEQLLKLKKINARKKEILAFECPHQAAETKKTVRWTAGWIGKGKALDTFH